MQIAARPISFKTKSNVFFKSKITAFLGIFLTGLGMVFFVILGIAFGNEGETLSMDAYEKAMSTGISIDAKITNMAIEFNKEFNSHHPAWVSFEYEKDGQLVQSKIRTAIPARTSSIQIGDTVKVRLMDNIAVIEGLPPFKVNIGFILLGPLIILVFGSILIIYTYFKAQKELYLYRFGIVSKGEVVTVTLKSYKHHDGITRVNLPGTHVVIYYKYITSFNQNVLGGSLSADHSLIHLKFGDQVKILISPRDEKHSCLYPENEANMNGWID